MRLRILVATALIASLSSAPRARAEHRLPPVSPASAYPDVDSHPSEHVSIAAIPFATEEEQKVFAVEYRKFRFLPIRVIVTNDGDRPISLADVRIFFLSANGDRIPAADPDDVERRVLLKDKRPRTLPIGPIQLHEKAKTPDTKIDQDFQNFEYAALAVEPHTTRAGFLWYDIDGLGDTPLQGAKLIVREVKNADGQQLFYFEIPFDKLRVGSQAR